MNTYKSIFLQQSYRDAWDEYVRSLHADAANWDYILLTASDENQAQTYRTQIEYRVRNGFLPGNTHYAVLPDPDGKRVGSGGATLNVLRYIARREQSDRFDGMKILVIHSGGDSKRIPQYSACGKIFSPVPRELPDGRASTLFDELIISMSGVAARMEAGMLVMSGDVLMLFNPLQIDFCTEGAAALTIKETPERGANHGVFKADGDGNVGAFLHKQPAQVLREAGAVDFGGKIHIDTGAVILSKNILNDLWILVQDDGAFDDFVNEHVRLSFYADFLYPMATASTFDQYLEETPEGDFSPELSVCRRALWDTLHKYHIRLMRLSPAAFLHFGTTREVLRLLSEELPVYDCLGWQKNVRTNNTSDAYAACSSYIHPSAVVGDGSYIEDSLLLENCRIGKHCVISGLELRDVTVPDGTVLHGLRLQNGKYVVRMYGVDDNPKGAKWFGEPIPQPLWTYPVHPVRETQAEAVDAALRRDMNTPGISLRDGFALADGNALLAWQQSVRERVNAEIVLEEINARRPIDEICRVFRFGCSPAALDVILQRGETADFSTRMRIFHTLSRIPSMPDASKYGKQSFAEIRKSILREMPPGLQNGAAFRIVKDSALAQLPVRVNWAGGWSDTPPYCLEHGGTVLNAAVTLGGTLPVRAFLERTDAPQITLRCLDNGAEHIYTTWDALRDQHNPFDQFAIQKAALSAIGFFDAAKEMSLPQYLQTIGGGFSFVTAVDRIPRGSGLGTSSILAAACVTAAADFFGISMPEQKVFSAVLCMEQLMSTGGGWQDQVGGVVPGIKLIRSESGLPQNVSVEPICLSSAARRKLSERFCLVYTGQRRLARNILREVVGHYLDNDPGILTAFSAIQEIAVQMKDALCAGDIDVFAALLDEHWTRAKALDRGCTNTCIEHIYRVCEDLTAGKSICGAGGGGFLQIMLKPGVTKEDLSKRLLDVYSDSGVAVWDSAFYWGAQ